MKDPGPMLVYMFPKGPVMRVRLQELLDPTNEIHDVFGYYIRLYGDPTVFDAHSLAYVGPERRQQRQSL